VKRQGNGGGPLDLETWEGGRRPVAMRAREAEESPTEDVDGESDDALETLEAAAKVLHYHNPSGRAKSVSQVTRNSQIWQSANGSKIGRGRSE
jgi:hypothetical protein